MSDTKLGARADLFQPRLYGFIAQQRCLIYKVRLGQAAEFAGHRRHISGRSAPLCRVIYLSTAF